MSILLAIDAGNTHTVCALYKQDQLLKNWRITTDVNRTADEYHLLLSGLVQSSNELLSSITDVIIASVVPDALFSLKSFVKQSMGCVPMVVGEGQLQLGITVEVDAYTAVGADRLVNGYAAYKQWGGNLIVIDFGTATTFDVINASGAYIGGVIAPGVNLSLDALQQHAAQLPRIAIKAPGTILGKSTISAMQSGIYYGYISMIEGMVEKLTTEINQPLMVIGTGGLSHLFAKSTSLFDHVDEHLTLWGLNAIFKLNKENATV